MKKLQTSLFSLIMAILLALPFISSAQAQTSNKAILDLAANHFYAGWASGNWEPFFATLDDKDFTFLVPCRPLCGTS